ncbi:MAG: AraC family transcriptional regulator [Pseudomonadota bacterium]|nr:AraC family transcriptional regulator [Pseudomonadota bacterium]
MTPTEQSPPIRTALPPDGVEIVRWTCAPALADAVTGISGYRELAPGHYRQRQPASLVAPIVISFGTPFGIGLGRAPGHNDRYGTFAAGLSDRPVIIDSFGMSHCLQIDFTPAGARRFFCLPMSELANRLAPLDDLLGSQAVEFRDRLGEMTAWRDRFALVETLINARLEASMPAWPGVSWAFRKLLETRGEMRIGTLAERLDCSRKHLIGKFHEEIGLRPKTVARIIRFSHALTIARSGAEGGWADVAAACGYADQAHLSREFRELAGETPSAWRARSA